MHLDGVEDLCYDFYRFNEALSNFSRCTSQCIIILYMSADNTLSLATIIKIDF